MTLQEWKVQYILEQLGSTVTVDDFPMTVQPPPQVSAVSVELTKEDVNGVLNSHEPSFANGN